MHISILKQLAQEREGISASIPDEVQLADYFFSSSWPKSNSIPAKTDTFKPSALVWLIREYGIASLLDVDVGRGNRIIACLMNSVKYVGIYNYLPMKKMAETAISKFGSASDSITLVYGSFDNIPIGELVGEHEVDTIFITLSDKNSEVQICNWIIKAWNNLDADGLLFIYSDSFTQKLRLLTSQVGETLVGVSQSSDKFFDLGDRDAKIRVWRKRDQPTHNPFSSVTLQKNVYRVGKEASLLRRAMNSYLRIFGARPSLHYVCNSFVPDTVVLDLASVVPVGNLTVHVNNSKRWNWLVSGVKKFGHRVELHSEDSNSITNYLIRDLDPREILLPAMLDSPIFEACLVQALRIYLPQDSEELITKERVWIQTEYAVLIRALLYVWPNTTLLISTSGSVDWARRGIDPVLLGRTLFYKSDPKSDVEKMRAKFGYEDDVLLYE